jgi:hypothetical protein
MYAILYETIAAYMRDSIRWNNAEVPVVFASPDRAFSEVRRIIRARDHGGQPGVSATDLAEEDRPVPTPFISVYVLPPKFAPEFHGLRKHVIEKNIQTGTALMARHPWPFVADVQVDLWCGSEGGHMIAMSLEPQWELRFVGGHLMMWADWSAARWYKPPFNVSEHAKYFAQKKLTLYTDGWTDNSDLEPSDGPRDCRRTWSGRLRGYLPFRPEEARIVLSVPFDVVEQTSGEVVDTFIAQEAAEA